MIFDVPSDLLCMYFYVSFQCNSKVEFSVILKHIRRLLRRMVEDWNCPPLPKLILTGSELVMLQSFYN